MVKFYFSEEQELDDIAWIYSEYDFFVKNKYKVYYPKISKELTEKMIEKPSSAQNKKILEKEFTEIFDHEKNIYDKTIIEISQNWRKIEKKFVNILNQLNYDYPKNVSCFVSRYGPGGSYYPDSKISTRVILENKTDVKEANETIAHEIVHLVINGLSEKYKLGFENTERLVDLILTKTPISKLLDNPRFQNFGDKRLDIIFDEHSTNLETLLKKFKAN